MMVEVGAAASRKGGVDGVAEVKMMGGCVELGQGALGVMNGSVVLVGRRGREALASWSGEERGCRRPWAWVAAPCR